MRGTRMEDEAQTQIIGACLLRLCAWNWLPASQALPHCGGCSEQQTSLAFYIFHSDQAISYSVPASRNAALHVQKYAKTSSPSQISDCITLKTSVFFIDHCVPKNNTVQIVPTYRCTIDGSQPNNSTISPHDPFSFSPSSMVTNLDVEDCDVAPWDFLHR